MTFFIWRKNVLFFRYLDFYVLWNPQISKALTSSWALLHNGSYTYAYLFWILSTIKIKFNQLPVYCMTNISNMFLAECWKLETSPRSFDNFARSGHFYKLTFTNVILLYSPFQKNEKLESWCNWLLSNTGACC